MNYQYYDLGHVDQGRIVEVTLRGNSVNVMLMDSSNFNQFKRTGGSRRFYGGHYKQSPVQIQVPRSGRWYVVINRGGHAGRWQSSVRILPGLLPPGRQTSLTSIPTLVRHRDDDLVPDAETGRIYDVFISHASEDKDSFVRQLAHALRDEGLKVWYDEFELRIGDSLRRKIDRGLTASRTGLVVLSPHFFSKGWTNYELDGIVTKNVSGEQLLLPIWHNVKKADVMRYSPSLADKVARSTADHTIEAIAAEISNVILSDKESAA